MLVTLMTIGLALAPLSPPAPFTDYIFQVPVRIENMRHITSALVSCEILHEPPGAPAGTLPVALVEPGTGVVEVPLRDGAYDGTVTVRAVVTAARLARYTPSRFVCRLGYRWRNADGTEFTESVRHEDRAGFYTRLTGQEIATATTQVIGTLPPP